jgi:hypothetical protein
MGENELNAIALHVWKLANSRDPNDPVFIEAIRDLPAAPMGGKAGEKANHWDFSAPYVATFRDGLDGKWLSLKAHGVLVASFSVSSFGSEQACIEAAWRYAYERSPAPTLGDAPLQCAECDCGNPPHACNWIKAGPSLTEALVEAAFFEGFNEGNRDAWYSAKSAWQQSDTLAALQKGGVE